MPFTKGRIITEEYKQFLREWHKNVDKSFYTNPERCRKISIAKTGANNPLWKGDNVSRKQLHEWVRRHKPKPDFCENCNESKPYDLANISQEYKRDVDDFKWICRRCHMIEDGRMESFKSRIPELTQKGSNSPAWKGGKPRCIECGKETGGTYKAIRCRGCYLKLKIRGPKNAYKSLPSGTI